MDTNLIKKKLETYRKEESSMGKYFWKPEKGEEYVIRFVPYVHRKEWPFLELKFYYNFKGNTMISPSCYGHHDPVLEFAKELQSTGDKDEWKEGKKLEPKLRIYAPIIVRGEEDEGVRFWGFSKTTFKDILAVSDDEFYGDFTDPKEGHDFKVSYYLPQGEQYPQTDVTIKPRKTPMTDDPEIVKQVKEIPNLLEIFDEPTEKELKQKLNEYLGGDGDDEKLKEEEVDEAFGDLDSKKKNGKEDEKSAKSDKLPDLDEPSTKTAKGADADSANDALAEFSDMLDE